MRVVIVCALVFIGIGCEMLPPEPIPTFSGTWIEERNRCTSGNKILQTIYEFLPEQQFRSTGKELSCSDRSPLKEPIPFTFTWWLEEPMRFCYRLGSGALGVDRCDTYTIEGGTLVLKAPPPDTRVFRLSRP